MTNALKPCPFCGNTKLEITPKNQFYEIQGMYGDAAVEVRCWECSAELWDHTRTEKDYDKRIAMLVEKWNRRANDEIRD